MASSAPHMPNQKERKKFLTKRAHKGHRVHNSETVISLSHIHGGKITNKEEIVNRHGVRAAYSWPRAIPKIAYRLRRVACTRTRTIPFAILRSHTTTPLPAAAIRGCAAAADFSPHAMGMFVGGM